MSPQIRGAQLARILGHWHALPGRRRSPDYSALADAVRGLLADGRLALGVRLPAERELAEALGISRTTISAAYRHLRDTGHARSRRGSGTWTTLPTGHRLANFGLWTPAEDLDVIDLGCAALAAPPQLVHAAREAAEDLPRHLSGAGYHPTGIGELREAIAALYTARGLPTSAEQIMVTNGTQHALDLVIRLVLPPGGPALVESPTYPNALAALTARKARIVTHGMSLDDPGWDDELLLATLRQTRPRLAYLIPEFQNPTGRLMPTALRERLVATAAQTGTDLVVDESFVDLALDDAVPPPPVALFDRSSRVVSIGGMSKPYWGGLRIGWVRASAPQVQRLAAARVGVDMASPVLEQLVAVRLLAEAATIVGERRAQLAEQRDVLVGELARLLPQWKVVPPRGGVCLWAELDGPVSSALSRAAEAVGVRLAPGPRFGLDGTLERFLRLPFTLPAAELVEAVGRIASVRYDLDRGNRTRWPEPAIIA